jgi:hypothetical protein
MPTGRGDGAPDPHDHTNGEDIHWSLRPRRRSFERGSSWPERFPVVGPLFGFAASTVASVVALAEGDVASVMILGVMASMLALAGYRNWVVLRKGE